MLRGRRDRHHRLGLLIPLTVGLIAAPIQFAVGDTAARSIASDQPVKFAAMECNKTTHRHLTEYIFGICTADGVKGGIGIPGFDSFLVGFNTDTKVKGYDIVPPNDRPPFNTMLHWAFDVMRTKDGVTGATGVWVTFGASLVIYTVLGVATVLILRTMSRRWRSAGAEEVSVPYGPSDPVPPAS